tara:strand:- start:7224 stop:7949 length:726 start_codon:yes stop_codon:yes gene_type:complete
LDYKNPKKLKKRERQVKVMSQDQTITESQMRGNMNRMYRWTRHVYDASRKYYLLGRDVLIRRLRPAADDVVCEIGCGTARNLIKLAQHYPYNYFCGIDASDEMLKTAQSALDKNNLQDSVTVKQGFAQSFDPVALFSLKKPVDKFVFSYALSIIPPWKESFDHALDLLESGGEIHIIDFGSQSGLPRPFRALLFWWLKMFHVYYKPEIEAHLHALKDSGKGTLKLHHLFGGYAYYAIFKKH